MADLCILHIPVQQSQWSDIPAWSVAFSQIFPDMVSKSALELSHCSSNFPPQNLKRLIRGSSLHPWMCFNMQVYYMNLTF